MINSVASYSLLGRSGLRVSPLCLGAMTFGTEWGWGVPQDKAFELLDVYAGAGGNFIDTADMYTGGSSERIIGEWMKARANRSRMVVATKFTFSSPTTKGDPNSGGNGRKHMLDALDGSLKRLGTDYVDLYWMHTWDGMTPVEEVMRAFDDVVRSGKVRYVGFSNVPAWYAARAQTIAEARGLEKIVALQLEYSLVERNIEREFVPMAQELGMAITPFSPLGFGLLTGKFKRGADGNGVDGEGRLKRFATTTHPAFKKLFDDRNWQIVDVLKDVAQKLGKSPAAVAVAWATRRPGITSTILGATTTAQLEDTLRALDVDIPQEQWARLEEVSRPMPLYPYARFDASLSGEFTAKTAVAREPRWYRG